MGRPLYCAGSKTSGVSTAVVVEIKREVGTLTPDKRTKIAILQFPGKADAAPATVIE
jgi:hypothetical protein